MSHLDDINPASFRQAESAAIYAGVSGSVGSTYHEERRERDGSLSDTFTKVERVAYSTTSPTSLWRVADATDPSIIGLVFLQSVKPGRATSHAAVSA